MKPVVVANWKMALSPEQSAIEARRLIVYLRTWKRTPFSLIVCPASESLACVQQIIARVPSAVQLGGQNCYWQEYAQVTGEVSPASLQQLSCRYVVVGHSDRRQLLGETSSMVCKKVGAAIACGLVPIICIGEDLSQRRRGTWRTILRSQLRSSLSGQLLNRRLPCMIAYEPLWAIGTGTPARADQLREVAHIIREILKALHGGAVSIRIPVLYGGSVDHETVQSIITQTGFNGVVVGSASQDARRLIAILSTFLRGNYAH